MRLLDKWAMSKTQEEFNKIGIKVIIGGYVTVGIIILTVLASL